ncbi:hypothetical protein EGW08_009094, partial [Elysia chlorotica]
MERMSLPSEPGETSENSPPAEPEETPEDSPAEPPQGRRALLASLLDVDHAFSWLQVFSYYFYNVVPFVVFVPTRFYRTTIAAIGLVAIGHIGLNIRNFFANKKKIDDRKARLGMNLSDLKQSLTIFEEEEDQSLTDLSFDKLSVNLKDGSLDQNKLLVEFHRRALKSKKFNFVTEYIIKSIKTESAAEKKGKTKSTQALSGIPVSISEAYQMN